MAEQDDWRTGYNEGPGRTLIEQIAQDMYRRNSKGRLKYGPDFVGDPLEQAYEEALDLSWYLAVARQRIAYLERQLTEVRHAASAAKKEVIRLREELAIERQGTGTSKDKGP